DRLHDDRRHRQRADRRGAARDRCRAGDALGGRAEALTFDGKAGYAVPPRRTKKITKVPRTRLIETSQRIAVSAAAPSGHFAAATAASRRLNKTLRIWTKTASITKKVAIIVYQSSGMLKARPARADADHAIPIIAAPHTSNAAIAIAATARKRL